MLFSINFVYNFKNYTMKNFLTLIISGLLLLIVSCASKTYVQPAELTNLLNNEEFTFMAERANPTNYDVINVMNSFPNSTSTRMLNLDYGYTIVVKKEKLEVTLPYFGRLYTPSMDNDKNSYRFSSKDYSISKSEGKKGSTIVTIAPKDVTNVRRIIMEVYKSGKAYVSIDSNDRQPISYDGYIMKNQVVK